MRRMLFFVLFACVIVATLGCIVVVAVLVSAPPEKANLEATLTMTLPSQPQSTQPLPKLALRIIVLTGANPHIIGKKISQKWGQAVTVPIHFVHDRTKVVVAAALVHIRPCVSLVRFDAFPTHITVKNGGRYRFHIKGFYENDRPVSAKRALCVIKPQRMHGEGPRP